MEFEGFALFKKGAALNRPDTKGEFGKLLTITIGDPEGNFSLHSNFPYKASSNLNGNNPHIGTGIGKSPLPLFVKEG
jgi:hypothetical protein